MMKIEVGMVVDVLVRGRVLGTGIVKSIEDAPRKMTGGRGISVEGFNGTWMSGYDPEDLRVRR